MDLDQDPAKMPWIQGSGSGSETLYSHKNHIIDIKDLYADSRGDSQVAGGTFGYVQLTYEMRISILVHSALKVMKNQNKLMSHRIDVTMLFFSLQK